MITQKTQDTIKILNDMVEYNCGFSDYEKSPVIDALKESINALIKLDKIKNIKTECADCDDDRICATCGAYFEFEKEVNRILERSK